MAQESSLHGTGGHSYGTGGLSPWDRKSLHGTGELSPWHRKAVFMAQECCPRGTGKQSSWHRRASPWHRRNPSDEHKSQTHAGTQPYPGMDSISLYKLHDHQKEIQDAGHLVKADPLIVDFTATWTRPLT